MHKLVQRAVRPLLLEFKNIETARGAKKPAQGPVPMLRLEYAGDDTRP